MRVKRRFLPAYGQELPGWGGPPPIWRPAAGGELVIMPLPVGDNAGQPYLGMDPSDPVTWVRPYNPQPGMVALLNFDGAKHQAYTPTGQVWRNPMRDRKDIKRYWWRR